LTLFGRRITLDWWSVVLATVLVIAVVAGWIKSVPF